MDREYLISVITEYMDSTYVIPSSYSYCNRRPFIQKVYAVFACEEILKEFDCHPNLDVETILERFRKKMCDFACRNKKSSFCFSVAEDVANDILSFLMGVI